MELDKGWQLHSLDFRARFTNQSTRSGTLEVKQAVFFTDPRSLPKTPVLADGMTDQGRRKEGGKKYDGDLPSIT